MKVCLHPDYASNAKGTDFITDTIITAFPEQWGKNSQDPSAVHQSIRTRLANAPDGEVRSVFDLALIIVDQCSRVFFDRSKPINQAPKLVDIFADAIRGVVSFSINRTSIYTLTPQ
jgi:hypothetical protein